MKDMRLKEKIPLVVSILLVLVGCYKVFFGANFFIHEDHVSISNYTYFNSISNGWRPDKLLGGSMFYGGLGVWNAWSVYVFFEKLINSRETAHIFYILFLGVVAVTVMYHFIKKIELNINSWVVAFIAPILFFCSRQSAYFYLRVMTSYIIGQILLLILLYNYYQRSRNIHLLLGGLLFFFVGFLGNLWSVFQLITLGFVFTILYVIYYKKDWKIILSKFIVMYIVATLVFLMLGFWEIYPLLVEHIRVSYMRVKEYNFNQFLNFLPDFKYLFLYIVGLLQVEWIPLNHSLAGLGYKIFPYSYNVAIYFPLIFLYFLFRKSKHFWEFALKWLLLIFILHRGLEAIPAYSQLYKYLSTHSYNIFTMYGHIFPFQVALIAIFISRIKRGEIVIHNRFGRKAQVFVSFILLGFAFCMFIVSFTSLLWPKTLPHLASTIIQEFLPQQIGGYSKVLIHEVVLYNLLNFQEIMHWHTAFFYFLSIVIILPFLNNRWLLALKKQIPIVAIAALLIVHAILYSWSVYPLNEKQLTWESKKVKEYSFKSTDRFYYVWEGRTKRELEAFRRVWVDLEGGHRERHQPGLNEPPGLNLSGLKSFETEDVGSFINHVFNGDGKKRLPMIRNLYYGGPSYTSDLMNMMAVKYYYADRELFDLPEDFELVLQDRQLYVYENPKAWPYFYLAKQLQAQKREHLDKVILGTAYLRPQDMFDLSENAGSSMIDLKKFGFGELLFNFKGRIGEFLVIADAWHPFWKAEANGKELPVIKANEVFKGVRLPPGDYTLRLYFDTDPYKKGIPISIVSWALFIVGFVYAYRHREKVLFEGNHS